MQSYSAQCFGTGCMGLNFGLVLTAWGAAGLLGPMLVARAKDFGGTFSGADAGDRLRPHGVRRLPILARRPAQATQREPAP